MVDLLSKGAAGCWSLEKLGPRMLAQDWEYSFYIKHFLKDMSIALEDCSKMNLRLKGLELAYEFYNRAKEIGWSEKDPSVVRCIKLLQ